MDSIAVHELIKLGSIKLGESGFSTACSEEHAIEILKNEACGIQADFIHITFENRPDLWSSCYRCEADFYQFKDSLRSISEDPTNTKTQVSTRVKKDRAQNTAVLIGALAIGFVIGFMIILY